MPMCGVVAIPRGWMPLILLTLLLYRVPAFRYIEENLRRARIHFCTPRMQYEDAVKDPAAAYRTFFDKEQLSSADPVPGLRCHTVSGWCIIIHSTLLSWRIQFCCCGTLARWSTVAF